MNIRTSLTSHIYVSKDVLIFNYPFTMKSGKFKIGDNENILNAYNQFLKMKLSLDLIVPNSEEAFPDCKTVMIQLIKTVNPRGKVYSIYQNGVEIIPPQKELIHVIQEFEYHENENLSSKFMEHEVLNLEELDRVVKFLHLGSIMPIHMKIK